MARLVHLPDAVELYEERLAVLQLHRDLLACGGVVVSQSVWADRGGTERTGTDGHTMAWHGIEVVHAHTELEAL